MKHIIVTLLLCGFVSAQGLHRVDKSNQPILFVVGVNQSPVIGTVIEPTLEKAKAKIANMASLDPICNAEPQVCVERAKATTYYILHKDGSITTESGQ